jgi:hypothetical protein
MTPEYRSLGWPAPPAIHNGTSTTAGAAERDVQRHPAPAHLHRQAGTTVEEPPDRGLGRAEPLPNILVSEAHQRMTESNDPTVVAMPVGQIVGRLNEIRPVADIIADQVSGFEAATARLDEIAER